MPTISAFPTLAQGSVDSPMNALGVTMKRWDILNHQDELLQTLANLHVVWAAIFMVVGVLCVINGYRWHKWVVVICAFFAGIGLGQLLSQQMGGSRVAVGAMGLLCAVIATPMLRIAVAVFGGLTGAFIGANAWSAFSGMPEAYVAGAGMGFVALAMASFLLFRPVVVATTSIGGAALAVLGGITLMLQVPGWEQAVTAGLSTRHLVSLLVAVGAAIGIVLQHSRGDAAAGGGAGSAKAKPAHS